MNAALSACKLFLELVSDLSSPLYYPLYASIVVCYVRPFTNNKPFGPIPKRFGRFSENREFSELHKELVAYRHEFIAHNDMTLRQALIVPPGVSVGKYKDKEIINQGVGTMTNNNFYPIEKFYKLQDLIKYNSDRINRDINEMTEKLYGGMELPKQKFELKINEGL